jgi:hypothetical protein
MPRRQYGGFQMEISQWAAGKLPRHPACQLRSLRTELDLLMAVDGYPSIADLRTAGAKHIFTSCGQ